MKTDLNRERRLRRQAKTKGLCVQRQTCKPISGYLISRDDSPLVIAGYNHYRNLMSLEEAEAFVEAY